MLQSLRRLLIPSSHGRQLCVKSRRNTPYYSATHFLPTLNTSDCEEISSGDDEYQVGYWTHALYNVLFFFININDIKGGI